MKLGASMCMVVVAVGACAEWTADPYPVGRATVTSAAYLPNEDAVAHIATETCRRQLSCGRVGPEKSFATRSSCALTLERETRDYLRSWSCQGVEAHGLASCVERIRNARCLEIGGGSAGLAECRAASLCNPG